MDLEASLAAVGRQNAEGCVKIVEDLARYATIIDRVRPTVIVECGTFSGRSAAWFARTAGCRVVTIDVADQVPPDEVKGPLDDLGVVRIIGDSTDRSVIFKVASMVSGDGRIMVVLDSDHSARHVYAEMVGYGPLVTPGSYMVVEDGILRWLPAEHRAVYAGDPLDAIEQWLTDRPGQWTVDVELEAAFPATMHPSGWLRRASKG